MTKRIVLLAVLTMLAGTAFGGPVTLYFGAPGFVWHESGSAGTANHIWTAGDYWEQTFSGTGLSSATTTTLNLFYDDNTLNTGNSLDMSVSINGTTVGTFVVNPGDTGLKSYGYSFSSILGPSYDIKMIATNTIAGGAGSVSMGDSNSSYVVLDNASGVPEPATGGTLLAALVGLAALRLRSRKAGTHARE